MVVNPNSSRKAYWLQSGSQPPQPPGGVKLSKPSSGRVQCSSILEGDWVRGGGIGIIGRRCSSFLSQFSRPWCCTLRTLNCPLGVARSHKREHGGPYYPPTKVEIDPALLGQEMVRQSRRRAWQQGLGHEQSLRSRPASWSPADDRVRAHIRPVGQRGRFAPRPRRGAVPHRWLPGLSMHSCAIKLMPVHKRLFFWFVGGVLPAAACFSGRMMAQGF